MLLKYTLQKVLPDDFKNAFAYPCKQTVIRIFTIYVSEISTVNLNMRFQDI